MKSVRVSQTKKFARKRRFGRAQWDHLLDPYKPVKKLREPTVCPDCGVVYIAGRWQWAKAPKDAQQIQCQACRRIKDRLPAGIVTLAGPLVVKNKQEMIRIARNQEKAERGEHPFNRIISIAEGPDEVVINTTDIHLPRRIGEAVKRGFRGALTIDFDENSYFVRVNWHREA
jgi:hypothetical protein